MIRRKEKVETLPFTASETGSLNMFKDFHDKYKDQIFNPNNPPEGFGNENQCTLYINLLLNDKLFSNYEENDENENFKEYVLTFFHVYGSSFEMYFNNRGEPKVFKKYTSNKDKIVKKLSDKIITYEKNQFLKECLESLLAKTELSSAGKIKITNNTSTSRDVISSNFSVQEIRYNSSMKIIKERGIDFFIRECKKLGKKLETGSLLISTQEMMATFEESLIYLLKDFSQEPRLLHNFANIYNTKTTESNHFLKYVYKNLTQNPNYTFSRGEKEKRFQAMLNFISDKNNVVLLENMIEGGYEVKIGLDEPVIVTTNFIIEDESLNFEVLPDGKVIHRLKPKEFIAVVPKTLTIDVNSKKYKKLVKNQVLDLNSNEFKTFVSDVYSCNWENYDFTVEENLLIATPKLEKITILSEKESKNIAQLFKQLPKSNVVESYIDSFKKIIETTGDNYRLYHWQNEALTIARNKESFIIWGDTSGGKTHVLMLIMIASIAEDRNSEFVYCAPTDQLAIQTFSNVISTFGESQIALIVEQIEYVPQRARIYIGTPKELADFFAKYSPRSNFISTYESKTTRRIVRLAVDECHTLSKSYKPDEHGEKNSANIYKLISSLSRRDPSEQVQFIGMSASLSQSSFEKCVQLIKDSSNILEIKLIYYTRYDAKMYTKPEVILPTVSDQVEINVEILNGRIVHNPNMSEEITVNNSVYEKIMFNMLESGMNSGGFFLDTEIEAIQTMENLINYLSAREESTVWSTLRKKYFDQIQFQTGLKAKFYDIIVEEIEKHINGNVRGESIECSERYFDELLTYYKKRQNVQLENVCYSLDLYGLLYEYKSYNEKGVIFRTEVHPMYNFGGTQKSSSILKLSEDGRTTDFGEILKSEGLEIMQENSKLISTLIKGLKYGIGLITSSIPLAFQMEISKHLMNLKKIKASDSFGMRFVISDDSLSMGIDLPLSSVAIVNQKRKPITKGQKKQKAGRAGRSDEYGNYLPSSLYLVNVSNYLELNQDEELSFDMQGIKNQYYNSSNIEDCLRNLLQIYGDGSNFSIDTFEDKYFTEIIFPEINIFPQNFSKYKYVKHCLRELYTVTKILLPAISPLLLEIHSEVQLRIYNYMTK